MVYVTHNGRHKIDGFFARKPKNENYVEIDKETAEDLVKTLENYYNLCLSYDRNGHKIIQFSFPPGREDLINVRTTPALQNLILKATGSSKELKEARRKLRSC